MCFFIWTYLNVAEFIIQNLPASMVYKCFDKKFALLPNKSVSDNGVNINVKPSEQLAEELH